VRIRAAILQRKVAVLGQAAGAASDALGGGAVRAA
jgi:hypothetical protein